MRRILWYVLQVGVIAAVGYWAYTTDDRPEGGFNPLAVAIVAIGCAAIVTGLVFWTGRGLSSLWRRLSGRAVRDSDQADYGRPSIGAAVGTGETRELPPGRWISKQPR